MWRTVRVNTFEELVELLDGVTVWIGESAPIVYDTKTHYVVKTDDAHRLKLSFLGE